MNKSIIVIGAFMATARPMTRQEYNDERGWTVPADENPNDAGYVLATINPLKPVDSHISWVPEQMYKDSYIENGALNFGQAWNAVMKHGCTIQRKGWNGKGLLASVSGVDLANAEENSDSITAGIIVYPNGDTSLWVPSPTDLVATDWSIIVEEA